MLLLYAQQIQFAPNEIKLATLHKIAQVLGVSTSDLIEDVSE
jgi:DNA-binding Xre family transcriptional regulator